MIFISYQHDSKKFVRLLRSKLRDIGIYTFWDEDILAGENWKSVIDKALQDSVGVIVVVTFKALLSPYVTYEWAYALGQGKRVIPVVLEMPNPTKPEHPKLHPQINDIQYRDFSNADDEQWRRLLNDVRHLVEQKNIPQEVVDAEKLAKSAGIEAKRLGIEELKQFDHPQATEALARLVQHNSPETCMLAAIALTDKSNAEDRRAIPGLLKALQSTYEMMALPRLLRYGNTEVIDGLAAIAQILPESQKVLRRRLIVDGLCKIEHPLATEKLIELVGLGGATNEAVIDALGNSGDPRVLPTLESYSDYLAQNLPEFKTRTNVLDAIAKIDHPDVPCILVDILKTNAPQTNSVNTVIFDKTLEYLTNIGGESVIESLTEIPETSLSYQQRHKIKELIIKINNALKRSGD